MTENTNKITQYTYKTKYWYDEGGNRVRKQVLRFEIGGGIEGDGGVNGGDGSWVVDKDEFYVRDIIGKEIAIYYGTTLQQWNLLGLDQIGHMNADTNKYFYLKDHLGSTRVVINTQNQVISALDYDPWGYILENRSYQPEYSEYKFTGKERDNDIENNYDYFGARYYDSRIANWTSIDPLFEKHFDYSPYNYVLRNPMRLIDPDGKQIEYIFGKVASNMPLPAKEGGKDFVNSEPNYERPAPEPTPGLIEPTNIEFLIVPTLRLTELGLGLGRNAASEIVGTSVLAPTTLKATEHAIGNMVGRNISKEMVNETLQFGKVFWDPKNKGLTFIKENVLSKGRVVRVGVDPFKKELKTVIESGKTNKLLKSRHIPLNPGSEYFYKF